MTRGAVLAALIATLAGPWPTPAVAWPVLSGPYFGQKPPGMRAEMFAPGIVSSEHHDDGPPAFSPDGRECFWRVMGQRDSASTIPGLMFWSREENGRWTEPRLAPFSNPYGAGIPCLQPDGQRLYCRFRTPRRPRSGDRHEAEWQSSFVDRTPSGWSEPRPFSPPIGSHRLTFFSVGADGSLLCVLEDSAATSAGTAVYRIRRDGDGFVAPESMGVVPTGAEQIVAMPTFSPDGRTFVFTARSEEGLILKASFRQQDGTWTMPRPLGDDINAPPQTKFAGFSPDGRYLFVVSNRPASNANPPKLWKSDAFNGPQREPLCDVYWVDAKAVEALRPADAKAPSR